MIKRLRFLAVFLCLAILLSSFQMVAFASEETGPSSPASGEEAPPSTGTSINPITIDTGNSTYPQVSVLYFDGAYNKISEPHVYESMSDTTIIRPSLIVRVGMINSLLPDGCNDDSNKISNTITASLIGENGQTIEGNVYSIDTSSSEHSFYVDFYRNIPLGKYDFTINIGSEKLAIGRVISDTMDSKPVINAIQDWSKFYQANYSNDTYFWFGFSGYNLEKLTNTTGTSIELVTADGEVVASLEPYGSENRSIYADNSSITFALKSSSPDGIPVGQYTLKVTTGDEEWDSNIVRLSEDQRVVFTQDTMIKLIEGVIGNGQDIHQFPINGVAINVPSSIAALAPEDFGVDMIDKQGDAVASGKVVSFEQLSNKQIGECDFAVVFSTLPTDTTNLSLRLSYKDKDNNTQYITGNSYLNYTNNPICYRMAGEAPSAKTTTSAISLFGWNLDINSTYTAKVYKYYENADGNKVLIGEYSSQPSYSNYITFNVDQRLSYKNIIEVYQNDEPIGELTFNTNDFAIDKRVELVEEPKETDVATGATAKFRIHFSQPIGSIDLQDAIWCGMINSADNGTSWTQPTTLMVDTTDSSNQTAIAEYINMKPGWYTFSTGTEGIDDYTYVRFHIEPKNSEPAAIKTWSAYTSNRSSSVSLGIYGLNLRALEDENGNVKLTLQRKDGNEWMTVVAEPSGTDYTDEDNWLNLDYNLPEGQQYQEGEYRLYSEEYPDFFRIPNLIFTSAPFVYDTTAGDEVKGAGESIYTIIVSGGNYDNLDMSKEYYMRIRYLDGTAFAEHKLSESDISVNNNQFKATFSERLPDKEDTYEVQVGYYDGDNFVELSHGEQSYMYIRTVSSPDIRRLELDSYSPQKHYTMTFKGWNLQNTTMCILIKDSEGNYIASKDVECTDKNSFSAGVDFTEPLKAGYYTAFVILNSSDGSQREFYLGFNIENVEVKIDSDPELIESPAEDEDGTAIVKYKVQTNVPLNEENLNQLWFGIYGDNYVNFNRWDNSDKFNIYIDSSDAQAKTAIVEISGITAGKYSIQADANGSYRETEITVQTKDQTPVLLSTWNWAVRSGTDDAWIGFNGLNLDKLKDQDGNIDIDLIKRNNEGAWDIVAHAIYDGDNSSQLDNERVNLHFRLENGETFSKGYYKVRANNITTDIYRLKEIQFTNNTFFNDIEENEVGTNTTNYTVVVRGQNLNKLNTGMHQYAIRLLDDMDKEYAHGNIAPADIKYDMYGDGTVSATIEKALPSDEQRLRVEVGYYYDSGVPDKPDFYTLAYNYDNPIYLKTITYPNITRFHMSSYLPSQHYVASFGGWNLTGSATVTLYDSSESELVKSDEIAIGENGFDYNLDTQEKLSAGRYTFKVTINTGNETKDFYRDFDIEKPYTRLYFDAPSEVWEITEQTAAGAEFTVPVILDGAQDVELGRSKVSLENTEASGYYEGQLTTEAGIVFAHFSGVNPGKYRIQASIYTTSTERTNYGEFEPLVVNSYENKAVVYRSSYWALEATKYYGDYDLFFEGYNMNALKASEDNNKVLGYFENSTGNKKYFVTAWVDSNSQLHVKFSSNSLEKGNYKLVIESDAWADSSWRVPDIEVREDPFITKHSNPDKLGRGVNNYSIDFNIGNLRNWDTSKKLYVRLENIAKSTPNPIFEEVEAIFPTDMNRNIITANFKNTLPEDYFYMFAYIGWYENGVFKTLPGEFTGLDSADYPYMYDTSASSLDDTNKNYELSFKGWNLNLLEHATMEICHWNGYQLVTDIAETEITINDPRYFTTNIQLPSVPQTDWYKCIIRYQNQYGGTDRMENDVYVGIPRPEITFDGQPDEGNWDFKEADAIRNGADFQIRALLKNIPDAKLQGSKVTLWRNYGDNNEYAAKLSFDTNNANVIVADFSNIQPGTYKLSADIQTDSYGTQHQEFWSIVVNSFDGKAVVTSSTKWALPASSGKTDFYISYFGQNLSSLIAGQSNNNISGYLEKIDDPNVKINSTPNFAWVYDDNQMELNFSSDNIPAGEYRLVINSEAWGENSERSSLLKVIEYTFVDGWCTPHRLGVGAETYSIKISVPNLAAWDNSNKPLKVRLMDYSDPQSVLQEQSAILNIDDATVKADFNYQLPNEETNYQLQIGYDDNGNFVTLPGGYINVPITKNPYLYDFSASKTQEVGKYNISIKGWNLPSTADITITYSSNGVDTTIVPKTTIEVDNPTQINYLADLGAQAKEGWYDVKIEISDSYGNEWNIGTSVWVEASQDTNVSVPTTVEITGSGIVVIPDTGKKSYTYEATLKDQYGNVLQNQTVVWTITTAAGITIDSTTGNTCTIGVSSEATTGTAIITATSTSDSSITVQQSVVIQEPETTNPSDPNQPVEPGDGDINNDGVVTREDAQELFNDLVEGNTIPETKLLEADLNGDGRVTGADITLMLRKAAEQ